MVKWPVDNILDEVQPLYLVKLSLGSTFAHDTITLKGMGKEIDEF